MNWKALEHAVTSETTLSEEAAFYLADVTESERLVRLAAEIRDRGHGGIITFSPKVFIPLTQLCRDVCHYCTFSQPPRKVGEPYLSVDQVLESCQAAVRLGCAEALFTLGEKPELRYREASQALERLGFASTIEYLAHVAGVVLEQTGLLPHINAGCLTEQELKLLRPVSASMGLMLESASERLCAKGMPHFGSPDKAPAARLKTIELAGRARIPFTSGILIGIGETRKERVEALLALRASHRRHGHIQEVIIQNFRAKAGTKMANVSEPDLDDLIWTIAAARLVFGPEMGIQAPPNLSSGNLDRLIAAGLNDWGGVSPLTRDYVNPEAPWPHVDALSKETEKAGKHLEHRLTIYPSFVRRLEEWTDANVRPAIVRMSDGDGLARPQGWSAGRRGGLPKAELALLARCKEKTSPEIRENVQRCAGGNEISEAGIVRLFEARGADYAYISGAANELRRETVGDAVTYAVNRNINYTNVCYFRCQFCAFSKSRGNADLRGEPYDLGGGEIARRCKEAWERGATEVCLQGGIHPDYTGQTYIDILETVRAATPRMHIHAFSPLEIRQGAQTLKISVREFLSALKAAGIGSLPGTAAEVLHDEVRKEICPDKLRTDEWVEVIRTAHELGIRSTATIMFGHVDAPRHWARHLMIIRKIQQETGGFTEFVPLPFVHMEAPNVLKKRARPGPTFREAVLMHAVSRLVFHGLIDNIQTSWVKMGEEGAIACLKAGANDLGGSLMNESITRAAGAEHGTEWSPPFMERLIGSIGRTPKMRTTLYGDIAPDRRAAALANRPLLEVENDRAGKSARSKKLNACVVIDA